MLAIYQGYQEQYQQALTENKSLKEQAIQNAQKIQEMQAEHSIDQEYKIKYEELLKKYQGISDDLSALQQQLTEMSGVKNDLSQAMAEVARLKKENNDLRYIAEKHKSCAKEVDNLKRQREMLTKERNKYQLEVAGNQNVIQQLTRQKEEMKAEIEKRKANSFWSQITPEQKLMAKRAAMLDAYRQLLEIIQGLKIDASTTVKDFVTTQDQIHAELQGFLRGAQVVEVRYDPDGICEVDVMMPLSQLVEFLTTKTKLQNGKNPPFSQIPEMNAARQIQATGTGTWSK